MYESREEKKQIIEIGVTWETGEIRVRRNCYAARNDDAFAEGTFLRKVQDHFVWWFSSSLVYFVFNVLMSWCNNSGHLLISIALSWKHHIFIVTSSFFSCIAFVLSIRFISLYVFFFFFFFFFFFSFFKKFHTVHRDFYSRISLKNYLFSDNDLGYRCYKVYEP